MVFFLLGQRGLSAGPSSGSLTPKKITRRSGVGQRRIDIKWTLLLLSSWTHRDSPKIPNSSSFLIPSRLSTRSALTARRKATFLRTVVRLSIETFNAHLAASLAIPSLVFRKQKKDLQFSTAVFDAGEAFSVGR